ncbi:MULTISPECIES: lipopolysaccharide heptosyltransferase II [unclassified Helicobacter]|uniref:lipopolysaccharide heptosyltransferase II n=1 Tax=unclassified Helicobacter TaxID=2593540 RepID=UPI000CF094A7|nr:MULTISPECIES: lipopolysaccharide heptosyltransferase II [unclassified Helicobacter]
MRVLIRMPNWLGDGVMISPIFEFLKSYYPQANFVLVGPEVVCELYKRDKRVEKIFIDKTKTSKSRFFATYRLAKIIGKCDIAITFTNHFYSALLLFFTQTTIRIGYRGLLRNYLLTRRVPKIKTKHQVLSYAQLLEKGLDVRIGNLGGLKLIAHPRKKSQIKTLGISTGAAFGASKIWYPEYFAQVVIYFLRLGFRVILFGNGKEALNNQEIYKYVCKEVGEDRLENLLDLSNQTNILELIDWIASLDIFLSNDSGPMHVAAALDIPLVALFGATHPTYCLPWKNTKNIIINKHLECSPCQKKICPLGHHLCMKSIKPQEVIQAIHQLLKEYYAN